MKKIKLKIYKKYLQKIRDGYKWLEVRNKDLNIQKGDFIEFIDPDEGFKVGEVRLKYNVSILDKERFFNSKLKDDWNEPHQGYGLEYDSDIEWLKKYLKNTDAVYIYELDLDTFKPFSYHRFTYILTRYNGEYFENKASFSKLEKAQVGLRAWKKREPDTLFSIERWELNNKNFDGNAVNSADNKEKEKEKD